MSKGTKIIRAGRVARVIDELTDMIQTYREKSSNSANEGEYMMAEEYQTRITEVEHIRRRLEEIIE